jgi:hypothetical protein
VATDAALGLPGAVRRVAADAASRGLSRQARLQRVQDAWLRELSRPSVLAASPELTGRPAAPVERTGRSDAPE